MTFQAVDPIMPGWAVMWGLAIAIYFLLKLLSWWHRKPIVVALWKHLAYLLFWPGMNVDSFLNPKNLKVVSPPRMEWSLACVNLAIGLGCLVIVVSMISKFDSYLAGWAGMIGLIFSLHLGLFHLLSLLWRGCGLQADPIMNWPIASQNLAEFWGRRWNLAFRDLTNHFLFRPLIGRLGPTGSLLTGFVVSGLIHELVISVPAHGGFGGPTTYFALQGVVLCVTHSRFGKTVGMDRGPWGRIVCAVTSLLPLPLLFHRPFVENVIIPFLRVMRSLR